MILEREYAVRVSGTPAPKGSLKCVGRRGSRAHVLLEDNPAVKPWRLRLEGVAQHLALPEPIDGPFGVEVTITVPSETAAARARVWPFRRSDGDADKHGRSILDGLADGRPKLFHDDAQVVDLQVRKVYAHTPHRDALDAPGAVVRFFPVG